MGSSNPPKLCGTFAVVVFLGTWEGLRKILNKFNKKTRVRFPPPPPISLVDVILATYNMPRVKVRGKFDPLFFDFRVCYFVCLFSESDICNKHPAHASLRTDRISIDEIDTHLIEQPTYHS